MANKANKKNIIKLIIFFVLCIGILSTYNTCIIEPFDISNINLLNIYNFINKIRLGNNSDGGYVIGEMDDGYDCYISAGISDEESFSRDFINKYNINKSNSYGFDGTINNYSFYFCMDKGTRA